MKYCDMYWEDVGLVINNIPNVEKLNNKTILVTGATGMICSAVVDVLLNLNRNANAGINLILVGRSKTRTTARFEGFVEGVDYTFIEFDASKDVELSIETDYIIHGASNSSPSAYVNEPVGTMLANIIGINNLLRMATKNNVKRVLFVSSSEVYGSKKESTPYCEDEYGYVDILNSRAAYPTAKRAAEALCIAYGEQYGIETVIVRPGHIYGPTITDKDDRATAQFTRNVLAGNDIVMKSAGLQLRSYCYTLDCASAILAVLINGKNQEAYNISNKNSVVTIRQIAEEFAKAGGKKVVFENPTDAEKKGYNLMSNSSLNSERLEELGWKASFNVAAGVTRTIEILK